MAQTTDDWCIDVFRMRLAVSRAPDLNTMHRVLSSGLEITQKIERGCQRGVGSNHYLWVVLFLRQRVNTFSNLHCCTQLVRHEGKAPLTLQCDIQEHWTIERMTQGLSALVTNSCLG